MRLFWLEWRAHLLRAARTAAIFAVLGTVAAAGYLVMIGEPITPARLSVGLCMGAAVGIAEEYISRSRFRKMSFFQFLLTKAGVFISVVSVVPVVLLFGETLVRGGTPEQFLGRLFDWRFVSQMPGVGLYAVAVSSVLVFFLQIDDVLGRGTLQKFLVGRYHRPTVEDRAFLFMDLKGSTTIAEKLGNIEFYSFLNEVFFDISPFILARGGEIYEYVGDEVVITWPSLAGGRKGASFRMFFDIRAALAARAPYYARKYAGCVPQFKAGAHCGEVVCAQIGDIKKKICYSGDVVNTASRIQAKCNEFKCDFLASADIVRLVGKLEWYGVRSVGVIPLRGKTQEVELLMVSLRDPPPKAAPSPEHLGGR